MESVRTEPARGVASSPAVDTESVCFIVHVPGDPVARNVLGTRYHLGPVTRDQPAIVLVHGATSPNIWDWREDFSVARNLARAGYTVIAYEQLGFGDSPYPSALGGYLLTFDASRAMLHEIVEQIRAGSYEAGRPCSGRAVESGSDTIVLIGHSGGGAIVSGYPGLYHDVSAVVQVAWSNLGLNPAFLLPGGGGWNAIRQIALGSQHGEFFLDDQGRSNGGQCRAFALYPAGTEPGAESFCDEPNIRTIAAPAGWFATLPLINAENLLSIARVGPGFPVLLAWSDKDWLFRPEDRDLEQRWWASRCGCDVTTWTQPAAGHAFVVHRSMPVFTETVVSWLHAKQL